MSSLEREESRREGNGDRIVVMKEGMREGKRSMNMRLILRMMRTRQLRRGPRYRSVVIGEGGELERR